MQKIHILFQQDFGCVSSFHFHTLMIKNEDISIAKSEPSIVTMTMFNLMTKQEKSKLNSNINASSGAQHMTK